MMRRASKDRLAQSKKDLNWETEALNPITLAFESHDLEARWRLRNGSRQRAIASRFLFMSAVFQLIFHASDVLEDVQGPIVGPLRLLLGAESLGGSLLIFTGLVPPSQPVLFWLLSLYGMGTVWTHYYLRPGESVKSIASLVSIHCQHIHP